MKFRKKPIIVEAEQFWPDKKPWPNGVKERGCVFVPDSMNDARIVAYWVSTLEGPHEVVAGDWIITGIMGERYPCKDSIFRQAYELVEEANS